MSLVLAVVARSINSAAEGHNVNGIINSKENKSVTSIDVTLYIV